jgi:hypothetical protein
MSAKFKSGQSVASQSGLAYLIVAIHPLDDCGSFSYTVRRLRAGVPWGPHREIAECNLFDNPAIAAKAEGTP